ncbi:hypothetical protein [Tichowtungia aerotolerans]|uniref:Uncharacterized protein n=1 Tax=Tichowtungia aerotolerans TaxID=2697043 RepID=A0A6P1M4A2_9BACT|nr:hypothetical protein [Tichowtungia aerotolerans]QHI68667.1 hypothetical protein GT409_04130 [Tichowtungia aerotolerans]
MKQDQNKLSLSAKLAKGFLSGGENSKIFSVLFMIIALAWFILGIKYDQPKNLIFATAFGMIALIWFLKAGCTELLEKLYTKKDSNQKVELTENPGGDF